MDRILEKKSFVVRYRGYLIGGCIFIAFLIYVIMSSMGGKKLRIESERLIIEKARSDKFMEYVDVEGIVQPILTLKINTREAGSVDRIIAEDGMMMQKGDTIMLLTNPDLIRSIEEQKDELEKQLTAFKEKEIEMEQKSINLKKQTLKAAYDVKRLKNKYELDKENYNLGIRSKAEFELAKNEYEYLLSDMELHMEGLKNDSAMARIREELINRDIKRERHRYERALERKDNLIVRAPLDGQLSFAGIIPGQHIANGGTIGEIKVMDQFKIHTSMSEYYIERIFVGLPATINYQGKKYPLKITRVVPEVKDRMFKVDLVFTDQMPDNVRIGKNYRVQIELGQPEEALIIGKGNFFQYTGGQWIYKLEPSGNRAVKVPVSVGRQNPQQYEIINGLNPGDQVILSGYEGFGDADVLLLK